MSISEVLNQSVTMEVKEPVKNTSIQFYRNEVNLLLELEHENNTNVRNCKGEVIYTSKNVQFKFS